MPALVDDIGVAVVTKLVEHGTEKTIENSGKIRAALARAWRRIFQGQVTVIITGLGGAGKTSLQKIISGQCRPEDLDGEYHISSTNEKTKLEEDSFVSIYTRPGQPQHHKNSKNYEQIFKAIGKARKLKVINVVSYGYDALHRMTFDGLPENVKDKDPRTALLNYLMMQRQTERDRLGELISLLDSMPASKTIDMLTVINKADLWHDRRTDVVRHYEGAEYGAVIQTMIASKSGRITHSMTSGSLVPVNLRTDDDVVLAPVLEGFDLHMRKKYLGNLILDIREFFR